MSRHLRPLLLCLLTIAADRPAAARTEKPNVLFIAIDDLRPALGCYGDPLAKTPNIDRLAATARIFTRAYCQQAVCGPSRASLLTGLLPDHLRVWHNRQHFRRTVPDHVTLPQLFKNHGWQTLALGKIFSGDAREDDPASWSAPAVLRAEGWKNYALPSGKEQGKGPASEAADVPDEGYPDGKLAALAVTTLAKLKQEARPFFLAVGFFKPHLPFNAPKRYWDLHDPAAFDPPAQPLPVAEAPAEARHTHRELGGYENMPEDERLAREQARHLRHGYYACVSYVDAQIGKVLAALDQLDLARDTIVVLWGDHGYALGEQDRWCKGTNFELDTRVPLLLRTPDLPQPGAATEALTEYVDLYPTLAELAGLTPPDGLDGRSLTPQLSDPRRPGRDAALSQFARPFRPGEPEIMGYSIRTATHRYTRWIDWKSRRLLSEELYDYRAPESVQTRNHQRIELANLIATSPQRDELRAAMDLTLAQRLRATPKPPQTKKKKQP